MKRKDYCEYAFDHQPEEVCIHCDLKVNEFGNTEEDFLNCQFPCCGCDGARLCIAKEGPSEVSCKSNVEGMHLRNDSIARRARMETLGLSINR